MSIWGLVFGQFLKVPNAGITFLKHYPDSNPALEHSNRLAMRLQTKKNSIPAEATLPSQTGQPGERCNKLESWLLVKWGTTRAMSTEFPTEDLSQSVAWISSTFQMCCMRGSSAHLQADNINNSTSWTIDRSEPMWSQAKKRPISAEETPTKQTENLKKR